MKGSGVLLPGQFLWPRIVWIGNFCLESPEDPLMCPYLSLIHWLHSYRNGFCLHLDTHGIPGSTSLQLDSLSIALLGRCRLGLLPLAVPCSEHSVLSYGKHLWPPPPEHGCKSSWRCSQNTSESWNRWRTQRLDSGLQTTTTRGSGLKGYSLCPPTVLLKLECHQNHLECLVTLRLAPSLEVRIRWVWGGSENLHFSQFLCNCYWRWYAFWEPVFYSFFLPV